MFWTRIVVAIACGCLWMGGDRAVAQQPPQAEFVVLPRTITLATTQARQRLLVQSLPSGRAGDSQFHGQVADAVLTSSDESVVRVEDGLAIPVGNGKAQIIATHEDARATCDVTVTGQDQPFTWSFRNHVESVLSKTGCNGGACHGARAGQKGFRLTLFGFDLEADHAYLTRHAQGRRVVLSDPARSLILTKPTGMIPHKGGVRFEVGSPEYQVLVDWVAAGAPGPQADDPTIQRLELLPAHSIQKVGARQQLVVLAHFSDGHVEDVTRWAKYTSVNQTVTRVNPAGQIEIAGSGEGAIKVWYLNLNELAFVSVPYENDVPESAFADTQPRNFIDQLVMEKLRSLNLPPSPVCDDATFLRRAYLDTIGMLPTADESRRFLQDTRADKRTRLVDHLLSRPEYVDYWAYKWSDLLLVTGDRLRPKAVTAYYEWIRGEVSDNVPWDQFVRQVVTASGSNVTHGPANFYALHQSPEEMAETMAQAFMGLSINCARCHNHPLEKWTNDQYYGLANLFSRVRAKGWGGDFRSDSFDGERVVFVEPQGELIQPSTGRPQPPRPLDGEPVAFDDPRDRRIVVAEWLTSADNPYFSKAVANRVWANFFGVGLKESVDDMRITNPASNEQLLQEAADYVVQQKFDLKQLMRAILLSETYQRSSKSSEQNQADGRFYARYYPRRLKAEVLLDAISQVTGAPSKFKDQPAGTRAQQLPDASVDSYFLSTFGRPKRLITCECERSDEPSMTQVLHLYNGNTLNDKLRQKDNRLEQEVKDKRSNDAVIEQLFLAALSRFPSDRELQQLGESLGPLDADDRRERFEDLYWSVLSSREFLFNH